MGKQDEGLRLQRLVFYKDDVAAIDKLLFDFLKLASAKCALMIDKDGHLVTRQGENPAYDTETISALVAASFSATKEMARLLGEEEFSIVFHQGKKDNIQLSLIGDRTILAVIFDDKTTIGMVRLYANQVSTKLAVLFEEMSMKKRDTTNDIASGFGDAAKSKLDDLLG
ncbi:MAG: hypothetical protein A2Z34_05555 [Planctomycetes bacterium RBG_16_59_8]|nr:MAG: hypothetical protein A2Z34_05555 [Planctomycetes bacterium RBG_16_59_8]